MCMRSESCSNRVPKNEALVAEQQVRSAEGTLLLELFVVCTGFRKLAMLSSLMYHAYVCDKFCLFLLCTESYT